MRYYRCNICGIIYQETELILDKDIGCICQNCATSLKELDAEQKELETMFRQERNSKVLP